MGMLLPPLQLHLTLPVWVHDLALAAAYPGDEAKVALAIELSRRNVEARSGGPFGAAVFDAHGQPYGALSITGIEARLAPPRQAELGRLLLDAAHSLTAKATAGPESRPPA